MKPPKCKLCGVEEWRHTCAPVARKAAVKAIISIHCPEGTVITKPDAAQKFDRTSYQRKYMADQKMAKAAGLTVKQWRAKREKI